MKKEIYETVGNFEHSWGKEVSVTEIEVVSASLWGDFWCKKQTIKLPLDDKSINDILLSLDIDMVVDDYREEYGDKYKLAISLSIAEASLDDNDVMIHFKDIEDILIYLDVNYDVVPAYVPENYRDNRVSAWSR